MNTENRDENSGKRYERPRLRVIELAAEEVMASGCKVAGGPSTGAMQAPCSSNICVIQGGS